MVSAVILSYNRCAEVLFTIDKLKGLKKFLTFDLEIIIVDNGSIDDTSERIKELHDDIVLVTKQKNNGIAGWNDGFAIAKGDFFIVLDDDSHIESGLEESISYLKSNSDVGILALNITGGTYETSKWNHLDEGIGFIGCGAIIRRSVYEKIGGFASWIMVYGHEWEYGIRCINANFKIRYFKHSSVIHRTSNINRTNRRVRIFTTRNELGLVYKHFQSKRLTYLIRVLINNLKVVKTEGVKAIYYCLLGGIEFLKIHKQLVHSPVTKETQDFFSKIFWGTQPVFKFLHKRISNLVKTN